MPARLDLLPEERGVPASRLRPRMIPQAIRDVRRDVAGAADAQVLQVLQMVDSLEVRGATDEVLAPVRPRLRAIQPARPLRFARLMFLPADVLIVAPAAWRAGTFFVPRSALTVLARAVREALVQSATSCLAQVEELTSGACTGQSTRVRQAGALLWPEAAGILRTLSLQPPPGLFAEWSAQGLPANELAQLAIALSAILDVALALHDHDHGTVRLHEAELAEMLACAEKFGPRAWGMMLGLLAIRVPQASPALFTAAQKAPQRRRQAEAAAEAALAWLENETAGQVESMPAHAAAELRRQTSLLESLSNQLADPAQRRRLTDARAALLAGSLQRFETALQDRVAAPLLTLPDDSSERAAALDGTEGAARVLRAFELEARRLGGGAKFDGLVRSVQATLQQVAGMSPMDRARLAEILAGPEAAVRMLEPLRFGQ